MNAMTKLIESSSSLPSTQLPDAAIDSAEEPGTPDEGDAFEDTFGERMSMSSASKTVNQTSLALVLVNVFLSGVSLTLVIPVLPKLLILALGGNASSAAYYQGSIQFFGGIIEIFAAPFWGRLSDSIGRKPVLLIALLGLCAEMLLIYFFWHNVVIFIAARMLASAAGVYFSTLSTIYADLSAGTGREAQTYGISGAVFGMSFICGPIAGGLLEKKGTGLAVLASAFCLMLSFVFAVLFVPETSSGVIADPFLRASSVLERVQSIRIAEMDANPFPRVLKLLRDPVLSRLAQAMMLDGLAFGGLQSVFFFFTSIRFGWDSSEAGMFFALVGVCMLVGQGLLTPLFSQRFPDRAVILFGYFVETVHWLIYALAMTPGMLYFGLCVGALGYPAGPTIKGVVARQVQPEEQGTVQGSLAALQIMVRPVSPLLANSVFAFFTSAAAPVFFPGAPFVVCAVLSSLSLIIASRALSNPDLK
ncbi:Tetracycline resistance protein, class C [Porphyridium purpureum]|uniref:Tetracycline resistance protein, class C n=1 Tax=Porphyridium purpureum TaxID=35688 RepID=A0A5J4Z6C7_PORPP|nr:Tetracycline resistance protein, class C [Porphyridium purpureum]|eukprot:POR2599..scf295_1